MCLVREREKRAIGKFRMSEYYQETFSFFLLGAWKTQSKNSWWFDVTLDSFCISHSVKEIKIKLALLFPFLFKATTVYLINFIILFIDVQILLTGICLFICLLKIHMTILELQFNFYPPIFLYLAWIRNGLKPMLQMIKRVPWATMFVFLTYTFNKRTGLKEVLLSKPPCANQQKAPLLVSNTFCSRRQSYVVCPRRRTWSSTGRRNIFQLLAGQPFKKPCIKSSNGFRTDSLNM